MKRIVIAAVAIVVSPVWIAWGAWHGLCLLNERVKELIR